ncbi:hypothetical protein PM082_007795 [Marasmius tenuissimus]|nr:hypothetical protein PM082_007795 [Marasmius tenuissimus]
MLANFFQNARNFKLAGCHFNQVQGDQYNYTTTIAQAKGEESTEFDGYYEVKQGAICRLADVVCSEYPRRWDDGNRSEWEEGALRVDRTVCTARVLERLGTVFTVVQYSGPDARRAFEEDFRTLSGILTSTGSQIYGYCKSKIPSLILYNELVPAKRLTGGWWAWKYLGSLAVSNQCNIRLQLIQLVPGANGLLGPGFVVGHWKRSHLSWSKHRQLDNSIYQPP